jgi:hypothetical protein
LLVYVNGDSHAAAAEAVNGCATAGDDPQYKFLKRLPHPDNIRVSFGQLTADNLHGELYCDAESGASNARILRTTREYIKSNTPDLIIIGWSTWEREEWLINGEYHQISVGSKVDSDLEGPYKTWLTNIKSNQQLCESAQTDIWQLHLELEERQIPHLFFNCFSNLQVNNQKDWGSCYIGPYNQTDTYWDWCLAQGFLPTKYYHFRFDAHMAWANHLTKIINESIITK